MPRSPFPDQSTANAEFKERLVAREPLLGAFFKTPHPILIEILARTPLDFLVVDAEHAPFDRAGIDTCLIAARGLGLPLIIRVPGRGADWIGFALDAGAAGVMVPHVNTADEARAVVAECHFRPGRRGFAGTTRAANYYGRSLPDHLESPGREVSLICQIEEAAAVSQAAEIAAVPGVDALFVGRADLAVSSGHDDFFGPDVIADTATVLGAEGAATGLYCAPTEDLAGFRAAGASLFVIGSEHTLMATAAASLKTRFDAETS